MVMLGFLNADSSVRVYLRLSYDCDQNKHFLIQLLKIDIFCIICNTNLNFLFSDSN